MGADGLPYEVKGEAEKVFNLLTTPSISLNAQFVSVPPQFRAEDITDVILGSVNIAACGPRGEKLSVTFDVASGNVSVSATTPPMDTAEQPGRDAAAVAAAHGAKLVLERYVGQPC